MSELFNPEARTKAVLTILSPRDEWIQHEQLKASAELQVPLSELADEPDWDILDDQGME